MQIDSCAEFIIDKLNENGFKAYCVGGCVRDQLLGRKVHDWDICTSALPDEVFEIFEDLGLTVIVTGARYGTVSILMSHCDIDLINQTDTAYNINDMDLNLYEVTTFRKESGGRKMDSVEFTDSLELDLMRRDFTINAMAFHPKEGMIDIVGGADDLANKLIRCIGDPERRFSEDYIRILRAVRFQAQLGFDIEQNTTDWANKLIKQVNCASPERIHAEFNKIVSGEYAKLALIRNKEIIAELFPELGECMGFDQNNPNHNYDIYEHSVKALDILSNQGFDDNNLRVAALFHDIGKPSTARIGQDGFTHFHGHSKVGALLSEKILRRLNFSSSDIKEISYLVMYHDFLPEKKSSVKKLVNRIGKDTTTKLIMLRHCDILAQSGFNIEIKLKYLRHFRDWFDEINEKDEAFQISDLDISGRDLIQMGYVPGLKFKMILNTLLALVLEEEISNTRDELVEYIKEHFPLVENVETV